MFSNSSRRCQQNIKELLYILTLLFQAALSLRESYILKAPNSKLSGKDKAAIVAKELGDFLGHYKRETELYTVFKEESGMVPRHIFEEFIAFASDSGSIKSFPEVKILSNQTFLF